MREPNPHGDAVHVTDVGGDEAPMDMPGLYRRPQALVVPGMTLHPLPPPPGPNLPPPFAATDSDFCKTCMFYAQKAAWMSTRYHTHFGEGWLRYACDRFLAAFNHVEGNCPDRVRF